MDPIKAKVEIDPTEDRKTNVCSCIIISVDGSGANCIITDSNSKYYGKLIRKDLTRFYLNKQDIQQLERKYVDR